MAEIFEYATQPPGEVDWPLGVTDGILLGNAIRLPTTDVYIWVVVLAGIVSFLMSWGIGANDVANAFATSVGSGAISLLWACIIAGIMESAGALLLGSRVTWTVRSSVLRVALFDPNNEDGVLNGPEMLMFAFFASLIGGTSWLILATAKGLPVSTTHSIVGSLLGAGLSFGGSSVVIWTGNEPGIGRMAGVVGIVVAWILSPVLSGIVALCIFLLVRTLVLRSRNSIRAVFMFCPLFYGFTMALLIFLVTFDFRAEAIDAGEMSMGRVFGVSVAGGALVALVTWFVINPMMAGYLEVWSERKMGEVNRLEAGALDYEHQSKVMSALRRVGVHVNVEEELSDEIKALHDNAEIFDRKTEKVFSWVQVFSASVDSFAHGANDVANAAAPFAAVLSLFRRTGVMSEPTRSPLFRSDGFLEGGLLDGQAFVRGETVPDGNTYCGMNSEGTMFSRCKDVASFAYDIPNASDDATTFSLYDVSGQLVQEEATCYSLCNPGNAFSYESIEDQVDWWIFVICSTGIVIGLFMWGYRVIISIGEKLTKLTPSRGFAIEIGASLTVLVASILGLPVSTTHCQVGATMGVGLADFRGGTVNWRQFVYIFIGWGITLLFTGFVSFSIYSFSVYAPNRFSNPQSVSYCPGQQMFLVQQDSDQTTVSGVVCAGLS